MRVHRQSEVGHGVLYLLALVEGQAAVDAVGHGAFPQRLLEDAALGVGAIQDGKVCPCLVFAPVQGLYFIAHDFALLHIAVGFEHAEAVAFLLFGVDFLVDLPLVLFYQAVGCTDDALCGAVVLLQLEYLCSRPCLGEGQDIVDVRPAERVDALRVVAHHADVAVFGSQLAHDGVLGQVGVLVFVHQYIMKMGAVFFEHVRMVAEQQEGVEQQVVEIHCGRLAATVPIFLVDIPQGRHTGSIVCLIGFAAVGVGGGRHQVVFGIGDARLHQTRLVGLLIQLHFLQQGADEAFLVGRVINREVPGEAQHVGFCPQDAHEHGVEGAHPELGGSVAAHLPGNAFLHLFGGLVGEGQGQDVPWTVSLFQQVGNLVGQYPRLSRAGTGNDQRGAVVIEDGGPLAIIQFVDVVGHVFVLFLLENPGEDTNIFPPEQMTG